MQVLGGFSGRRRYAGSHVFLLPCCGLVRGFVTDIPGCCDYRFNFDADAETARRFGDERIGLWAVCAPRFRSMSRLSLAVFVLSYSFL